MESKNSKVASIFESLEYGPAPESPNIAREWLDKHNRKFGHFIDGKWVRPEGRKELESRSPAKGEKLFSNGFISVYNRVIGRE